MSAQLELREWTELLISIAARFFVEPQVRQLLDAGKYEEAAELCIKESGPGGLQQAITEEFGDKKLARHARMTGALALIPKFANGPVITTNFDHALERTFREARKQFVHVLWGAPAAAMIEAFQKNRCYLFKIHGDVDHPEQRILTRDEYNQHYGEIGKPESKALPLRRVIEIAMANRPLLFLGCSLKSDRIVGFLKEFYAEYQRLMHYAIVWRPADEEKFRERAHELTQLGLMPIWYPFGEHSSISTILEHVLVGAERIKAPKNKVSVEPRGPSAAQEALANQKYDELAALGAAPLLEERYQSDAAAIAKGELVLFLGWGAHLLRENRPDGPPSWSQVAQQLAEQTGYDEGIGSVTDFTRLTQYIYETQGEIHFENYMRDQLGRAYPPTLAHWFVTGLPTLLRAKNYSGVAPVILTANQDDVLERTFEELGEPLDLLSYIGRGPDRGHFFYRPASGPSSMIRTPKQAARVSVKQRPLLVKLHGSIDRRNPEAEKMVLTEDDYLSYLARTSVSELLPPAVQQHLIQSSILFIGYALRDWTIRVLLKQIWDRQIPRKISCAILLHAGNVTRTLLTKQGVVVINESWENVLAGMVEALRALPPRAADTTPQER